jgi:hypothetical protein
VYWPRAGSRRPPLEGSARGSRRGPTDRLVFPLRIRIRSRLLLRMERARSRLAMCQQDVRTWPPRLPLLKYTHLDVRARALGVPQENSRLSRLRERDVIQSGPSRPLRRRLPETFQPPGAVALADKRLRESRTSSISRGWPREQSAAQPCRLVLAEGANTFRDR